MPSFSFTASLELSSPLVLAGRRLRRYAATKIEYKRGKTKHSEKSRRSAKVRHQVCDSTSNER